jgi:hypothetical protein
MIHSNGPATIPSPLTSLASKTNNRREDPDPTMMPISTARHVRGRTLQRMETREEGKHNEGHNKGRKREEGKTMKDMTKGRKRKEGSGHDKRKDKGRKKMMMDMIKGRKKEEREQWKDMTKGRKREERKQ